MPNHKYLDKQLKKTLKKHTDDVISLKDETWHKINQELFPNNKLSQSKQNKSSNRMWSWTKGLVASIGGIAVAALLLAVFIPSLLNDETQQDLNDPIETDHPSGDVQDPIDNSDDPTNDHQLLSDQFDKEKQGVVEPEGIKETITLQLQTNEEWRYVIYIDKDRYEFVRGDNVDHIVPIEELPSSYPNVSFDIQLHEQTTEDNVIAIIKENIAQNEMTILEEKTVTSPVNGTMITAIADGEPGLAAFHRYYVMTVEDDTIFSFTQMLFEGAWEGLGVRFDHMLETFEWVSRE